MRLVNIVGTADRPLAQATLRFLTVIHVILCADGYWSAGVGLSGFAEQLHVGVVLAFHIHQNALHRDQESTFEILVFAEKVFRRGDSEVTKLSL